MSLRYSSARTSSSVINSAQDISHIIGSTTNHDDESEQQQQNLQQHSSLVSASTTQRSIHSSSVVPFSTSSATSMATTTKSSSSAKILLAQQWKNVPIIVARSIFRMDKKMNMMASSMQRVADALSKMIVLSSSATATSSSSGNTNKKETSKKVREAVVKSRKTVRINDDDDDEDDETELVDHAQQQDQLAQQLLEIMFQQHPHLRQSFAAASSTSSATAASLGRPSDHPSSQQRTENSLIQVSKRREKSLEQPKMREDLSNRNRNQQSEQEQFQHQQQLSDVSVSEISCEEDDEADGDDHDDDDGESTLSPSRRRNNYKTKEEILLDSILLENLSSPSSPSPSPDKPKDAAQTQKANDAKKMKKKKSKLQKSHQKEGRKNKNNNNSFENNNNNANNDDDEHLVTVRADDTLNHLTIIKGLSIFGVQGPRNGTIPDQVDGDRFYRFHSQEFSELEDFARSVGLMREEDIERRQKELVAEQQIRRRDAERKARNNVESEMLAATMTTTSKTVKNARKSIVKVQEKEEDCQNNNKSLLKGKRGKNEQSDLIRRLNEIEQEADRKSSEQTTREADQNMKTQEDINHGQPSHQEAQVPSPRTRARSRNNDWLKTIREQLMSPTSTNNDDDDDETENNDQDNHQEQTETTGGGAQNNQTSEKKDAMDEDDDDDSLTDSASSSSSNTESVDSDTRRRINFLNSIISFKKRNKIDNIKNNKNHHHQLRTKRAPHQHSDGRPPLYQTSSLLKKQDENVEGKEDDDIVERRRLNEINNNNKNKLKSACAWRSTNQVHQYFDHNLHKQQMKENKPVLSHVQKQQHQPPQQQMKKPKNPTSADDFFKEKIQERDDGVVLTPRRSIDAARPSSSSLSFSQQQVSPATIDKEQQNPKKKQQSAFIVPPLPLYRSWIFRTTGELLLESSQKSDTKQQQQQQQQQRNDQNNKKCAKCRNHQNQQQALPVSCWAPCSIREQDYVITHSIANDRGLQEKVRHDEEENENGKKNTNKQMVVVQIRQDGGGVNNDSMMRRTSSHQTSSSSLSSRFVSSVANIMKRSPYFVEPSIPNPRSELPLTDRSGIGPLLSVTDSSDLKMKEETNLKNSNNNINYDPNFLLRWCGFGGDESQRGSFVVVAPSITLPRSGGTKRCISTRLVFFRPHVEIVSDIHQVHQEHNCFFNRNDISNSCWIVNVIVNGDVRTTFECSPIQAFVQASCDDDHNHGGDEKADFYFAACLDLDLFHGDLVNFSFSKKLQKHQQQVSHRDDGGGVHQRQKLKLIEHQTILDSLSSFGNEKERHADIWYVQFVSRR